MTLLQSFYLNYNISELKRKKCFEHVIFNLLYQWWQGLSHVPPISNSDTSDKQKTNSNSSTEPPTPKDSTQSLEWVKIAWCHKTIHTFTYCMLLHAYLSNLTLLSPLLLTLPGSPWNMDSSSEITPLLFGWEAAAAKSARSIWLQEGVLIMLHRFYDFSTPLRIVHQQYPT